MINKVLAPILGTLLFAGFVTYATMQTKPLAQEQPIDPVVLDVAEFQDANLPLSTSVATPTVASASTVELSPAELSSKESTITAQDIAPAVENIPPAVVSPVIYVDDNRSKYEEKSSENSRYENDDGGDREAGEDD